MKTINIYDDDKDFINGFIKTNSDTIDEPRDLIAMLLDDFRDKYIDFGWNAIAKED